MGRRGEGRSWDNSSWDLNRARSFLPRPKRRDFYSYLYKQRARICRLLARIHYGQTTDTFEAVAAPLCDTYRFHGSISLLPAVHLHRRFSPWFPTIPIASSFRPPVSGGTVDIRWGQDSETAATLYQSNYGGTGQALVVLRTDEKRFRDRHNPLATALRDYLGGHETHRVTIEILKRYLTVLHYFCFLKVATAGCSSLHSRYIGVHGWCSRSCDILYRQIPVAIR